MRSLQASGPVGLYIHIPYCRARCRYCDFNTYAGIDETIPAYVSALSAEISLWSHIEVRQTVDTLFFGGGTPTVLPARMLCQILDQARNRFSFKVDAEITTEANPGTVDEGYLVSLRQGGLNRLSLGVQSFDDEELVMLGRVHMAEDVYRAVNEARRAGFTNLNLDLIYGLPGQGLDRWVSNLDQAISTGPQHISLYGLSLEEGTTLAGDVRRGILPEPDPDLAADMYLKAEDRLEAAGYIHYEISNWAKPGYECRHNLRYWRCEPYIGFGAGAHSFYGNLRFENVSTPQHYIQQLSGKVSLNRVHAGLDKGHQLNQEILREAGLPIKSVSAVSVQTMLSDRVILGLRLIDGIEPGELKAATGYDLEDACGPVIEELIQGGLMERAGARLRLSRRGRLLGNEVFQRFLELPALEK